jgi:hypothetical protein
MHIHLLHAGEGNSWTRMLWMFYYTEWNQENTYIVHVKYCWQTYFKSIGTLSQTFKNHIHNNIVTVACGEPLLVRNQDIIVSEWGDMSIHGLLFQWANTIKIQLSVLV